VKGHTYKRCPCGTLRDEQGRRINCAKRHRSWSYIHDLPLGPDGKRRQTSAGGFASEREARKALNESLARIDRGIGVDAGRQRVGEYLEQWLAGKASLRSSSRKSYEEHVKLYLAPGIGHLRMSDLRDLDIERLYAAMRLLGQPEATTAPSAELERLLRARKASNPKPLSDATIRRVHATLMSALNNAVKRKRIAHNPAAHVDVPTGRRPRAVVWTADRIAAWQRTGVRPRVAVWTPLQTGAFLDHAHAERLYPIFHFIAYRGLRRGEAVGLRWEDVDLDGGHLHITQQVVQLGWATEIGAPKTDSGARSVSLDETTADVLRTWRTRQASERAAWGAAWTDTGLVFTREDGTQLHPDQVTTAFERLSREAGLPPIRLHDLRHTAASLALQAGVPLKVVSEQLGHSSLAITADTYTSVLPAVARAAAEAVAGIIPRAPAAGHDAAALAVRLQEGRKEASMGTKRTDLGPKAQVRTGAPPGTRTPNPRIKSPLLCQLS
jgi:integrase